jgi:transcriptional regulator with XRE-family HTH domain
MRDHGGGVRTRVGRTIRQLRLLRGWSQELLAERANSSPKHVGRIERGQVDIGLNSLTAIANALSVNIADLFVEPPGRRSVRGAIHVISGDDLAHLEHVGAIARRIRLPRARPLSRSPR